MTIDQPTVLILGPTAGGKTRLAIDLAQRLPGGGECICCDSMQVYRGMDIGTAKPTAQEQNTAPHHLLDVIHPGDDTFSVERWLELAHLAISEIRARGRWPIIVGGTNLYVRAFLCGMMDGPPPDAALRSRLNAMDSEELRAWLVRIDPATAERVHTNDRKRTIRAIEVFELIGKKISEQQTQWAQGDLRLASQAPQAEAHSPIIIGLNYSVEAINSRINTRVKAIMDAGFLEEVWELHGAGAFGRNAREALGYKQLIEFLDGRCSLRDAVEQIKIKTRRYAKQQRTWLRRFGSQGRSAWFEADKMDTQELADQALAATLRLAKPHEQLDIRPLTA